MSTDLPLIFEKRNGIAYLTLNRPEVHNAMDLDMGRLLLEAWEEYAEDKSLRCAILTGAGEKSFCSGADLAKLTPLLMGARPPANEYERRVKEEPHSRGRANLRDPWMFKPVVAAINGQAIAGGMEMLYGADIRVASSTARFGLQEAKWAVFPSGGSTVKLPQMMTYSRAMEILLTGELISAEQALEWGFLNKVVPPENVMEEAEKYATRIAKNGPLAVAAIKESVLSNWGLPLKDALYQEREIAEARVVGTKDSKEGPRAFKEKREPNFIGE